MAATPMSICVYAYLERRGSGGWLLADRLAADDGFEGHLVPLNIAPRSWGSFNFAVYYEASGERDLPADISDALRAFIDHHGIEPNRPSWWTVAEAHRFQLADHEQRFAHFDTNGLLARSNEGGLDLRIVFWAD